MNKPKRLVEKLFILQENKIFFIYIYIFFLHSWKTGHWRRSAASVLTLGNRLHSFIYQIPAHVPAALTEEHQAVMNSNHHHPLNSSSLLHSWERKNLNIPLSKLAHSSGPACRNVISKLWGSRSQPSNRFSVGCSPTRYSSMKRCPFTWCHASLW